MNSKLWLTGAIALLTIGLVSCTCIKPSKPTDQANVDDRIRMSYLKELNTQCDAILFLAAKVDRMRTRMAELGATNLIEKGEGRMNGSYKELTEILWQKQQKLSKELHDLQVILTSDTWPERLPDK